MFRLMVSLLLSALAACATGTLDSPKSGLGNPTAGPETGPSPVPSSAGSIWSAPDPASDRFAVDRLEPVPMAPVPQLSNRNNDYAILKGGYYKPDTGELDEGYIANLALGRYFTRLFAVEFEFGYFEADGSSTSLVDKLKGVPLMANARLNLPIFFLEGYLGAGLGAIYYDIDTIVAGVDDDGWLFAGNGFLGADIALADTITLGLEAKYYVTEEFNSADLNAFAAFVTLGIRY